MIWLDLLDVGTGSMTKWSLFHFFFISGKCQMVILSRSWLWTTRGKKRKRKTSVDSDHWLWNRRRHSVLFGDDRTQSWDQRAPTSDGTVMDGEIIKRVASKKCFINNRKLFIKQLCLSPANVIKKKMIAGRWARAEQQWGTKKTLNFLSVTSHSCQEKGPIGY